MRRRSAWLLILVVLLIASFSLTQAGRRDERYRDLAFVSASAGATSSGQTAVTLHRLLSNRLLKALQLAKAFGLLDPPVQESASGGMSTQTIVDEPDPVGQSGGKKDDSVNEEAERERQEKENEAGKKGNETLSSFG